MGQPTPQTNSNQQTPQQTQTAQTGQTNSNQQSQTTQTAQNGQTNSNNTPIPWPSNLPLTEKYIYDPQWPSKLRLNLDDCNWEEWSHRMELLATRQGFEYWLKGTFLQPDLAVDAGRHFTWKQNDSSLRVFMLETMSLAEYKLVQHLPTANTVWTALRQRHEKRGTYAQLMLIKNALDIRFCSTTPLNDTIHAIENLITRIANMGDLNWPTFKTIVLMNALRGEFGYLQEQVHAMANDPGFSATTVIQRVTFWTNFFFSLSTFPRSKPLTYSFPPSCDLFSFLTVL